MDQEGAVASGGALSSGVTYDERQRRLLIKWFIKNCREFDVSSVPTDTLLSLGTLRNVLAMREDGGFVDFLKEVGEYLSGSRPESELDGPSVGNVTCHMIGIFFATLEVQAQFTEAQLKFMAEKYDKFQQWTVAPLIVAIDEDETELAIALINAGCRRGSRYREGRRCYGSR